MTRSVLAQLAVPLDDADRRRARLTAFALAGAGAFLLAAEEILRLSLAPAAPSTPTWLPPPDLAYVDQPGLRVGIVFGVLLMVVPFATLDVQALRTGTAARERRFTALSLAGATPAQLRAVAVREGTRAAVRGGLGAGVVYLLCWVVLGPALPAAARMLPTPDALTLVAWACLLLVLAAGGGLAALAAGTARVTTLGTVRRVPRPLGRRDAVLPVVGVMLWLGSDLLGHHARSTVVAAIFVPLLATVLIGLGTGPWLVLATGRVAVRQGLVPALAGRRLLADVRTPGRVAGVVFTIGLILQSLVGAAGMAFNGPIVDGNERTVALSMVAAGTLLALVVTCGALVASATEQVLDGRRGVAVVVALAASPSFVTSVVRAQFVLTAGPAAVAGTLFFSLNHVGVYHRVPSLLLTALLQATFIAIFVAAVAALAARAVRPAVLDAARPENLRAT